MAFPESRILTSSDFIEILYNGRTTRHFCFILGSGASVESGIPSGNMLEMDWMDCLMGLSPDRGTRPKKPERTRALAEKLFLEGKLTHPFSEIEGAWNRAKSEKRSISSDYYFDIYQLRFHPHAREGYRYLEKIMDPCQPSLGYHPLALMLTEGSQNNLVITTNFDSLVEDSLFLYTDKRPLVVSHESLANFIDPDVRRPIVAKVHRGLMYGPFNSPDTTDALKPEWQQTLDYAFKTYTPIVIGYGGGDGSLMKALQSASFRNGIYWCYRAASGLPDQKIQDFVEAQEGCFVAIDGFDALMMEMGRELFGQRIAPSETRNYLQSQSDRRMRSYTEQWNALDRQPGMEAVLDPLNQAEEEAREKRAEENALTSWDYFDRAYKAASEGRQEDAIRDYTLAIELDPNYAAAYINRGSSYHKLKQDARAIEDYNKAISLDPNHAVAHSNRGVSYQNLNQHDRAIEDFNKAISLDPNYANAYYNRGNSHQNLKQYDRAIEDHNKAISLDPNDAAAYNNRGNSYQNLEQYDLAIEDYNKAISLDPNDAVACNNRGISYQNLNQDERAIEDFNKAISLNPNYAFAYYNRGNSYQKLNQDERAIEDFNKAISLDPSYANAYNNRGISYQNLNQNERAIEDYNKAISLDPNYAFAYNNRGICYKLQKQYDQAIADYSKAIELNPKYINAYRNRARAYRAMRKHALAKADDARADELKAEE